MIDCTLKNSDLIKELESLARSGQWSKLSKELKKSRSRGLPESIALPMAQLARRAFKPRTAISILSPLIYNRREVKISDSLIAEYSVNLSLLGLQEESLKILQRVSSTANVDAIFARISVLFSNWEYQDAIPLLKDYISLVSDPYKVKVGKVNLISAFIEVEQYSQATLLINDLLFGLKSDELTLKGNLLELLAQVHFHRGFLDEAQQMIEQSHAILANSNSGLNSLFIRKWMALIGLKREPSNPEKLQNALTIIKEAEDMGHWETSRDIHFQIAMLERNESKMIELYFGCSKNGFRRKIVDSAICPNIPRYYLWPQNTQGVAKVLDLVEGVYEGKKIVKTGSSYHRLLYLLGTNFFSPVPRLKIFSSLYPNEHYIPGFSENKVDKVIARTRDLLKEASAPVEVLNFGGGYILRAEDSVQIRIESSPLTVDIESARYKRVRDAFRDKPFTSKCVSQILSISERSAQRSLRVYSEKGLVSRTKSGSQVFYQLAS